MADPNQPGNAGAPGAGGGLFTEPKPEPRSFPTAAVGIAVLAVLVILGLLLFTGRHRSSGSESPDTLRPLASYAPNIKLSNLQLSESTSFSGGKSTFLDGQVTNAGTATVTGITVQVLFASQDGGAPQLETAPITLVRTRQPYVDVQPISAAPLAPGAQAEFRLIFEGIKPEWNQQLPEIHVVEVTSR